MKVNTDPCKPPGSEPPGSASESLHQQGKLAPVSVFGLATQVDFGLNSRKALKPHFFIAECSFGLGCVLQKICDVCESLGLKIL